MKNKSFLKTILYIIITIFFILLAYFLTQFNSHIKRKLFPLIAILGLAFLILGIIIIFLAKKEKGKLKLFLILTGVVAIVPFISSILHNLFYGLSITFKNFKYLFEALHITFFIIAIIIAPILFTIGVIGCIAFLNRKTNNKKI